LEMKVNEFQNKIKKIKEETKATLKIKEE